MTPAMPPLPARIARLRLNEHGYPVPWFVAIVDGKPDFRVVDEAKLFEALKWDRCWICGEPMGAYKAFVVGPMCAVNLVSSEPPSHRECAEFSAQACPFLTNPEKDRRAAGIPEGTKDPGGIMITRNPGVTLVWVTKRFKIEAVRGAEGIADGVLMRMGPPEDAVWYARGRLATRDEVLSSINSGLGILRQAAERDGAQALEALSERVAATMEILPTSK